MDFGPDERGSGAAAEPRRLTGLTRPLTSERPGRFFKTWWKGHGLLGMFSMTCLFGPGCEGSKPESAPAPVAAPRPAAPAPVARIVTADLWQDLIAQRPGALTLVDGRLVVELGRVQARANLDLGTGAAIRLGEEFGEERGALVFGAGGTLTLPLDGELAPKLHPDSDGQPGLAMAVTLRAMVPGQAVTALWNEQPLAHLSIGEQWERRTFSLPAALVRAGENRLRLHFSRLGRGGQASAAIGRVEVGPRAAIVAGPAAQAGGYRVHAGEGDEVSLDLSQGTSLVFYALAPRRGRLRVEGRGEVAVLVSTDAEHREGRPPALLLDGALGPAGRDLDLSGYGGQPLRIEVRTPAGGEGATLRVLQLVAGRSRPVDRRERKPRDLIVLAVEGARADDLLGVLLGGPRFPAVERLAAESLVFERAYAVSPWAVPTHAALLSSVPPPGHATVRGTFVADGQVLLPELLDRAGYYGVAVAANADFNAERGLIQGLDHVRNMTQGTGSGKDARSVVRAALEAIAGRPAPRFVYADMTDPQAPYDPPREHVGGPPPPDAPLPHLTHLWLGRVRAGRVVAEPAQRDYVRRLYRGELQVVDAALADLLAAMEEQGGLDEAALVLVGLHGEEFFEHGGALHGFSLHEESLRVPLVIRAPALLAPGRVTAPVDLLDLAPTLADLLGLPFPPQWQGDSLVPLIDDPQPPPRLVVAYLGDGARAAVLGDYKLIVGSGRDAQRLYDLAADPGETRDLEGDGGIALRLTRTALAWETAAEGRWKRSRWGTGADLKPAFALDHGM
ncbi:sulfatase-like hydrolase/transferase [Nannocystis pusilla]|uniref:sulfatase-like hydrolase/transferase n=1 Tax=Nannocystis pusilla TaxID=889268 RepID=UPI003DA377D7